MTAAEADRIVAALEQHRVVLTAILAELQGWRQPAIADCPHPPEALKDRSSMGAPWIQCGLCGVNVKGGPS